MSDTDQRRHAFGQVDIQTAAKADQAKAVARLQTVALFDETDDAPRHKTRDLHHADAGAIGGFDGQAVAFVVNAGLVQRGIHEFAVTVDDVQHLARDGRAVHVAIENVHEHRHAGQRFGAQTQPLFGDDILDQ